MHYASTSAKQIDASQRNSIQCNFTNLILQNATHQSALQSMAIKHPTNLKCKATLNNPSLAFSQFLRNLDTINNDCKRAQVVQKWKFPILSLCVPLWCSWKISSFINCVINIFPRPDRLYCIVSCFFPCIVGCDGRIVPLSHWPDCYKSLWEWSVSHFAPDFSLKKSSPIYAIIPDLVFAAVLCHFKTKRISSNTPFILEINLM